jgi:hypothetical protein
MRCPEFNQLRRSYMFVERNTEWIIEPRRGDIKPSESMPLLRSFYVLSASVSTNIFAPLELKSKIVPLDIHRIFRATDFARTIH